MILYLFSIIGVQKSGFQLMWYVVFLINIFVGDVASDKAWGYLMLKTGTSEHLIMIQTTIILKGTSSNTDTWMLGEQDQAH